MRRTSVGVGAGLLLLALSGCSGSGGGSSASPSGSASHPGTGAGRSSAPPAAGAPFDDVCRAAPQIRSARVDANTLAGGQLFRVRGSETLSAGRLSAADLDVAVSGGHTRVIVSGGALYARGPAVGSTSKYIVVSEHESEQKVHTFEFELGLTLEYTRPGLSCDLRTAATGVHAAGARTVDGVRASRFTFSAVSAKLPATSVLRAEQSQNGVKSASTTLDVDAQGRPVQLSQHYKIGGAELRSGALLSRFGSAVHVQVPAPDQISH